VSQLSLTGDETSGAEALIPGRPTLSSLREAASGCTACPLHETATQTVFGEGLKRARLMLIGEQPGDREDIEGHPFVGPAGRILDEALEQAEIERGDAYITNVVKHFKWTPKGKRRIHQAPRAEELKACAPWLEAELEVVDPEVVVCLGATAVRAVIGTKARVMKDHGQFLESKLGLTAMPTLHPSAILRADPDDRDDAMALLVGDLSRARDRLAA
jgi:uracil-DNA glycosylase family protein